MTTPDPPRRPPDASRTHEPDGPLPASLLNLPWIDPHNHAHTLSWADRERFALSGCAAMVMVAAGIHWTPSRPARAADVRHQWDGAVDRLAAIGQGHGFAAGIAVGVHTGIRVADPDALLGSMAGYLDLEETVAVGETGVTPTQRGEPWPVDEQLEVVRAQLTLAERNDLPVILHTPNPTTGDDAGYRSGVGIPGYERNSAARGESVIDAADPAIEAVRLDMEAVAEAGLDERRVVASHADPNNLAYLLEETACRVSFTLGQPWLTGVTAGTVAEAIERHGAERIMVETDAANVLRSDVTAIKRAILELYRRGIAVEDIRRVVLENPREHFDLPG